MRPDTFHGLVLIVIICIIGAPIILPAIVLISAAYMVVMLGYIAFHIVKFLYLGFRYGDWRLA